MKRVKIVLSVLLLILLVGSLFSCKKEDGAPAEYYSSLDLRRVPSAYLSVPLGDCDFDSFFPQRGMIKVSKGEGNDKKYGVLNADGETVLPANYTYVAMSGDFFLAEGGETSSFYVIDLQGKVVCSSPNRLEITDVGDGYVAVKEGDYSFLCHREKGNVLSMHALDKSYEYLPCGNYILARSSSSGKNYIFSAQTGEAIRTFVGSSTLSFGVYYVGGNDFIVVRNEFVEEGDHTFALKKSEGYDYIKQTVSKYTVGVASMRTLSLGRAISVVQSRYTFGLSQYDRESICLKEGYYVVRYYLCENDVTDGTTAHYLADDSLREVASLPEGINPLSLTIYEGVGVASGASGCIYLLNGSLEVIAKKEDAIYQSVAFAGQVVTASKIVNGSRKLGGFDRTGREVLPFEYNYLSAFVGGKAIGVKSGKAYLIDTSGKETPLADEIFPYQWDGFYEKTEGGMIGLTSFDENDLIPCRYTALVDVKRFGSEVLVALSGAEGKTEVYRLF